MDSLCLKTGLHVIAPPIPMGGAGGLEVRTNPTQVSAVGRSTGEKSTTAQKKTTPFSRFSFKYPLKSFWPGGGRSGGDRYGGMALDDTVLTENGEEKKVDEEGESGAMGSEGQSGNWVLKILHVRSAWREEQGRSCGPEAELRREVENGDDDRGEGSDGEDDEESCDACRIEDDDEKEAEFDRDSFSRLLRKVSLAEARLYAQMSYLGNLAYCIPKIQPGNLLRCYGLRFVTSSIDKRELAAKAEKTQELAEIQEEEKDSKDVEEVENHKNNAHGISASAAYHIAASAASYLHSHTRSILPLKSSKGEVGEALPEESSRTNEGVRIMNSEMASLMATTDSVTAVVAAKEEVKQAVADDLNSAHSSPCEWFVCDDDESGTRFFVIQGSESLASWQANLLFEPIQFEGLDVLVHRGIYEAAKGMYEQMLPEVLAHLKSRGDRATFRFTGHSLGGSLALLINLMLLIRNEVPVSSLLPVITFGSPSIMCGGDLLLRKLGLPLSHVQSVTMHRDIVPRAFSCNYPNHVAEFLKAVNGNFRNHPCLNNQKLLYAPMGDLLILQPDEKFSPNHHLLPSGTGLYLLTHPLSDTDDAEKLLRDAKSVFFNSPHPLEILRDRSAYGSEGAIQRDHDMNSYLKCVRGFIRQELNHVRKAKREHRRKVWWPLVTPRGVNAGIIVGRPVGTGNLGQEQFNFSGIVQTGRESLQRFSRLVASQHMHLFVVLLSPARLLLLGAYNVMSFH
ncbi:Fungal lipase-like domain containing protein [Parasponia andersonii]|uniref:Fungal lipase-like domain containing protein n=1 Tax=Parasponia andersonii TaxID=3476 RepID=A0A2P5CKV6_PARAD|nr:Fungal lipase-like domain containing protein [Parasponia andersonii]